MSYELQNRIKLQTIKLQDFLEFMCIDEYTGDAFQEKILNLENLNFILQPTVIYIRHRLN